MNGNVLYSDEYPKKFTVTRWRDETVEAHKIVLTESALIFQDRNGGLVRAFNNHSPHGWHALRPKEDE